MLRRVKLRHFHTILSKNIKPRTLAIVYRGHFLLDRIGSRRPHTSMRTSPRFLFLFKREIINQ